MLVVSGQWPEKQKPGNTDHCQLTSDHLPSDHLPYRSFSRITNFNPDHTPLTAHTFTSTSPAVRPIARITFSSRSLATPELFFGQLIHNMPAGANRFFKCANCFFKSARVLTHTSAKSKGSLPSPILRQSAKASFSSALNFGWQIDQCHTKLGLNAELLG
jgi:hypothetical protein